MRALDGWPPPVLDPAGPYAEPVTRLAWALLIGGFVVFAIVVAAVATALWGSPKLKRKLGGDRAIWIGGFAFPVVVLTGLLSWGLSLTSHLSAGRTTSADLKVRITGEMWWWRVDYPDAGITDANELHIPAGRPVTVELAAADVIHSFWVPRLGGKMDMIPGRTNRLRIQADAPGVYAGQCAEYCGGPHALMGFVVVAHAPADFARWQVARRARPAPNPRGQKIFQDVGCAACHTIRGTTANGLAGPDLTHVGTRRSLGAGILPNNPGTMAGWIADSQRIKPGNRMPAYKQLSAEELRILTEYMVGRR